MVHLVKKKFGNNEYLYIQKSYYYKGKRKTKHIAYLGRADKYSANQLNNILNTANTGKKRQLAKLIKTTKNGAKL